jgi:hypothetical protein
MQYKGGLNMFIKRENTEIRNRKNATLRETFWNAVGKLDSDVLAFLINPAFQGMPSWPDLHQAYRRILTESTMILATDGLSDEFSDSKRPNNGYGIELYIEIDDKSYFGKEMSHIKKEWFMDLLVQAAMNAANMGVFRSQYEQYGVFSMEFTGMKIPEAYSSNGRVGVLIGMQSRSTPQKAALVGDDIYLLSLTLLTSRELDYIVETGRTGRMEVVAKLKQNGNFNISSVIRKSVI